MARAVPVRVRPSAPLNKPASAGFFNGTHGHSQGSVEIAENFTKGQSAVSKDGSSNFRGPTGPSAPLNKPASAGFFNGTHGHSQGSVEIAENFTKGQSAVSKDGSSNFRGPTGPSAPLNKPASAGFFNGTHGHSQGSVEIAENFTKGQSAVSKGGSSNFRGPTGPSAPLNKPASAGFFNGTHGHSQGSVEIAENFTKGQSAVSKDGSSNFRGPTGPSAPLNKPASAGFFMECAYSREIGPSPSEKCANERFEGY